MAFQWNAFSGSYGYVSSTIFSTNNTRQIALAFAEYLCNHDKTYLHKLGFFAASLVSFHIGVTAAFFATKYFQIHAIYIVWVFLIPALALIQRLEMETTTKKEDLSDTLKEGISCRTQTNY
jgi:uncharacterized membrane protein YoaK (UPF0700 family)